MGTDFKSVMPRTRVNQWLGATKETPSLDGAFLFRDTPIGKPLGVGYWDGGGVLAESLGKSYPWAVG